MDGIFFWGDIGMKKRRYKVLIIGIFFVLIGLYLSIPDGKLRLIFCDVGQGDGTIIIKGNRQILIDTGADNGRMERCLDRYLPFWDKNIEGVIISHWDKDHSEALNSIVKSYKIEKLLESTVSGSIIENTVLSYETLKAGDRIVYGDINFEVLHPNKIFKEGNESSLVIILSSESKKFIFTGDVDLKGEGEMMSWWNEKIDGIKISHHGSDTASGKEWLERLRPGIAVISVGKNDYGHPKEVVLERLKKLGINIFRTDQEGDVVLSWN